MPLLAALSFEAAAHTTPTTNASYTAPGDWALPPSDARPGGKFRLLFLTSTTYRPTPADIADLQPLRADAAAGGHRRA